MAGVTVKFSQFFDRSGILDQMTRKEQRVLSGTGAYGRTVVKRSIKKAPKRKPRGETAGKPPRFHVRGRESLKDRIFFGFDPITASVTVGPEKFNANGKGARGSVRWRLLGSVKTIPELLEKGGTRVVLGRRSDKRATRVVQKYKPRPYVGSGTASFRVTQEKMRQLMADIPL